MRSFLGMACYYKAHVAGFSEICVPLTDLLKKDHPKNFVLNDYERQAFEHLKDCLCLTAELASPNPLKPFNLQCHSNVIL